MNEINEPLKIAVMISGGGTTLRNLIALQAAGELPVEIALVVSSSKLAKGIQFAEAAGIPVEVIRRQDFKNAEAFSAANFDPCRAAGVELVVLGGYLKHVLIPGDFENRVINIHPSLIPSFSGQGFYGQRVHSAVIEHGCKVSGCTVHFVDNEFDHGPIIDQRVVTVLPDDTPATLAARVFEAECIAYPAAIRQIASRSLKINGRIVSPK